MLNLKNLRTEFGLSQKELAEALSPPQNNVCNREQDKYQPDFNTLIKTVKCFDVSTDYLLGSEDVALQTGSSLDRDLLAPINNLSTEKKQALKILLQNSA